jgi:predicted Na+-dependent transporter
MLAVTLGARAVSSDPARIRTVAITINARAVGLALALATLHLDAVEGLRATILAYGGLTQVVPLLFVLIARRMPARLR